MTTSAQEQEVPDIEAMLEIIANMERELRAIRRGVVALAKQQEREKTAVRKKPKRHA